MGKGRWITKHKKSLFSLRVLLDKGLEIALPLSFFHFPVLRVLTPAIHQDLEILE